MNPEKSSFYNNYADDKDGYPKFNYCDDNDDDEEEEFDEDDRFFDDLISGKQSMNGDDSTWQITENMSPGLLALFGMTDKSNDKEIKIAWTAPIQSGLTNSEPIIQTPFNVSPGISALPPMHIPANNRDATQREQAFDSSSNRHMNESVAEFLDDVITGKQNMSGDDSAWQITENMSPGLLALFGKSKNPNHRPLAEKSMVISSAWQAPPISGLQNSDPIIRTSYNAPAVSVVPRSSISLSSSSSLSNSIAVYPSPPVRLMDPNGGQSTSSSYQRHYDFNGEVGVLARRRSSNSNPLPASTSISILGGSQSTTTIDTVAKDRDSEVGDAAGKVEGAGDSPLESDWKPPSHAGLSNSNRIVSTLKY
eukprot:gene23972-32376_t